MAKIKRRRFVVEGSGAFPVDMLRYDQAFPEHENPDSHLIETDAYFTPRRVTLLSDCPTAPTEARWRSFSWRVVSTEIVA